MKKLLGRLGPGFITAAIILGPGSIVVSSRAGAESEYRLVWLLALACFFMATFAAMGARLGCALEETPLQYIAQRWGRWLALTAGLSAFLVTAGFQFGNNLGVAAAFAGLTKTPAMIWPPLFTVLSITFLLTARRLYQWLEKGMMLLVGIMIVAFVANLFRTDFHPARFAAGCIPRPLQGNDPLIASSLLATTFSAVAAFYQAYLVRAKGWTKDNVSSAIVDAWVGIAVLGCIVLAILLGAAGALYETGEKVENAGQLAGQLRGLLGEWASLVFLLGLAAASFSSFIANALIGGTLMADALGQDASVDARATKAWTITVMLIGCTVAVGASWFSQAQTTSLLIAQASTLVAAPLTAVLLYLLCSSKTVMGNLRNRWPTMIVGGAGLAVMAWLSIGLFLRLIAQFSTAA